MLAVMTLHYTPFVFFCGWVQIWQSSMWCYCSIIRISRTDSMFIQMLTIIMCVCKWTCVCLLYIGRLHKCMCVTWFQHMHAYIPRIHGGIDFKKSRHWWIFTACHSYDINLSWICSENIYHLYLTVASCCRIHSHYFFFCIRFNSVAPPIVAVAIQSLTNNNKLT